MEGKERVYCYQCRHFPVPIKNKPCNTCILTKIVNKRIVDTYERNNFEAKDEE